MATLSFSTISTVVDLSGSFSTISTVVDLSGSFSTISTVVAPTPSTISTVVAPTPSTISTVVDVSGSIPSITTPPISTMSTIIMAPIITMSTLLSPPSAVISLDDLLNHQTVVLAKESTDRNAVLSFISPTSESLKAVLFQWASGGFQGGYVVNTLSLMPPSVCSDGMSRNLPVYMEYLMGKSIGDWLETLGAMTAGMSFTFSHNGSTQINLHVTRL